MPRFQPVLTPAGGAVLIIAMAGLIRSLINRNSYEILLSCIALLILLALGIIGVWKSRKLKMLEPGWKPPFPMTASSKFTFSKLTAKNKSQAEIDNTEDTIISGLDGNIPLFFRLHFFVRGRFFPCGITVETKKGSCVFVETSAKRGETSANLQLGFPMSGIFLGDGYCRLCDIFGLFSFSCGIPQHRTINVRCMPCFGKKTPINAQSGAEDQRNKPAADIERYYMREYTPGDRFRDINWKSSDKIDTLITRISTDNQEKISRLEIHFRNFGPTKPSLQDLWLLDRAKARLSYFLRSLMEQNSSYIFDVRTAKGNWEIENNEDLDAFFEELAGISFFPPVHETIFSAGKGDIYVFSTACDFGLHSFLLASNPRPVTLFVMQPSIEKKISKEQKEKQETEVLFLTDFYSKGATARPGWFVPGKTKPLGVNASRVEMFYTHVALSETII